MSKIDMKDLKDRTLAFQLMKLPGQPMGMHMGTSYLVQDLWSALNGLVDGPNGLRGLVEQWRRRAIECEEARDKFEQPGSSWNFWNEKKLMFHVMANELESLYMKEGEQ